MLSLRPAGELPRGLADALVLRSLTLFGEPVGERIVVGNPCGAVFEPLEAPQAGAIHLCEHELDALALARSGVTGSVRSPAVPAWRVSFAGRCVRASARRPCTLAGPRGASQGAAQSRGPALHGASAAICSSPGQRLVPRPSRALASPSMKAVFDTRPGTDYDDDIIRRYHFPNRYLPAAKLCVGDWIVYRVTRRGSGRPGYVAVARVTRLKPDPSDSGSSYALVTDFLRFDVVVPFRPETGYFEERLRAVRDPGHIGREIQGRSVRTISDADFGAIVRAGLRETLDPHNLDQLERAGADESVHTFVGAPPEEQERRIVQMLVNRPFRDAAFRTTVVNAYEQTCAVTGLRIVNGGGRVEVQAAHIWSVKDGGPDIVQNGLALSATCHWLFDRHLISLTDDYGLLVSHNRVPGELRHLFANQLERIHLPSEEHQWPRRDFIARHREKFDDL